MVAGLQEAYEFISNVVMFNSMFTSPENPISVSVEYAFQGIYILGGISPVLKTSVPFAFTLYLKYTVLPFGLMRLTNLELSETVR